MEYSHKNHYKWGWDGEWFNSPGESFNVSIGSCAGGHLGLRAETGRAVELLANQFTKPIAIGLSGGADSQAVCLSMMDRKIKFQPLILKLIDSSGTARNMHDIQGAADFCNRWGLTPIYESLDMKAFYEGVGRTLAEANHLRGGRTLIQLHLVEKYRKTHAFIMAGGDITMDRHWQLRHTDFEEITTTFSPTPIQQHLISNEIEGCTKFFMYTPELIAAYIDNPIVNGFIHGHKALFDSIVFFENGQDQAHQWRVFTYFVKPLMYADQWPELIHRQKFHGFEQAQEFDDLARQMLDELEPYKKQSIQMSIQHLKRHVLHGHGEEKIWTSGTTNLTFEPSPAARNFVQQMMTA